MSMKPNISPAKKELRGILAADVARHLSSGGHIEYLEGPACRPRWQEERRHSVGAPAMIGPWSPLTGYPDYEGRYEIDPQGNVRNIASKKILEVRGTRVRKVQLNSSSTSKKYLNINPAAAVKRIFGVDIII